MFDVDKRTIYRALHGSHAYGTSLPSSDVDIRGVCIPPTSYHLGFVNRFEQHIREAAKGHEHDLTIYALGKFAGLAADCNPSIIEMLFVAEEDILFCDRYGEELRANRQLFLSTRARHTFSGYAHSQLKRIKTHRAWLLSPPKEPPSRKELGLPEQFKVSKSDLGAFEKMAEEQYAELSKEALTLLLRERAYKAQKAQWEQYLHWKKTRNPARAELEAKYGLDTKHAGHLIRLLRMCKEILRDGQVVVKRPDAEELLAIRRGERSYEDLVAEAEALDAECEALYRTSPLPKRPDLEKLDALVIRLTEGYLKEHG